LNAPFFSIIIPVYNRAKFISLAIESSLKQTFKDFELIIIDDGSTDNTAEVVNQLDDSRITYFYQENKERGAARNHGVQRANGTYVFFLDSDDLIDPEHLELAKKGIETKEYPSFLFTGIKSNETGELAPLNPDFGEAIDPRIILRSNVCASAFFLKREFALDNPFVEDRRLAGSEDRLLLLEISKKTELHYFNYHTYSLINHADRSMHSVDIENWEGQLEVLSDKIISNDTISSGEVSIIRSSFLQMVAIKLLIAGHFGKGMQWYWNSLIEKPAFFLSKNSLRVFRYGIFVFLKKPIKTVLLMVGCVYLLINVLFVVETYESKRDFKESVTNCQQSEPQVTAQRVVELVSSSFNFKYRPYKCYENPISYLINTIHPGISQVCDSKFLFEHSDDAFCGQQSKLIADIARKLKLNYRYVVFSNHVAIELFYNDNWHYFDPTNTVFVKENPDNDEHLSFFELYSRNRIAVRKNAEVALGDLSEVIIMDKNINFFNQLEWFNRFCLWAWYASIPTLAVFYVSRYYWKRKIIQVLNLI
tara:strand:- start:29026 stop:30627 length:1602 start_codon:yes stop_codon:yes gene_type:complete